MTYDGKESIMTAVANYCGWFQTTVKNAPTTGFEVTFKQTIGNIHVTAEGPEKVARGLNPVGEPINLDSIAALNDTLWIIGNPSGPPDLFSAYPNRLGDCPVKTLSVMMFDWYDGSEAKGRNGYEARGVPRRGEGTNEDFGADGCTLTKGMVEPILGSNGVPVRVQELPSSCTNATHLDYWFLPDVINTDASGKKYTNATCRDLELELTDDGFWLGQRDDSSREGGLFFLDDFRWLDEEGTVENVNYDSLSGNKGYHNFGFTMKIQAKFEYVPGQYFEFNGDDDVWVFINNRLVVDIGGQHTKEFGSVDLDTLGLEEGKTYPFHIFYAERKQTQSNFMMRTSIDLRTEASIFLTDDRSTQVLKNYDVWQVVKKDALSCDSSSNELADVDTVEGPSNYRLTGGNLGEAGVMLDTAGMWFEGITIEDNWYQFSIDSARIVENNGLAPGHYYLEVSLKNAPEQKTGVWITIPPYKVPTLVFATEQWKPLGAEVSGDTLQIGKWTYEMYKVQVMFLEDWATVSIYNQNINLTSSDPNMKTVDETGKAISKVVLDSTGRATFYVIANAPVTGATLQAKGAAASAAVWTKLKFEEPPIPRISSAIIIDRNGDGRGDSVHIKFNKQLGGDNNLDSLKFAFGEGFPTQTKENWKLNDNKTELTIVSSGACEPYKACGFSSLIFTGGKAEVYTGSIDTWFTYTENSKGYHFHIAADPLTDGVNPIVTQAVKSITKSGHELALTFSEAITEDTKQYFKDMFRYVCIRGGEKVDPEKPAGVDNSSSGNTMNLLFTMSTYDAVIPSVGDSVGFVPQGGSSTSLAEDLSGIKPHKYSPLVRISGQQDMQITGTDVLPLDPDNEIVKDKENTTQPILVTNKDADAKQVSDEKGVQGHLIGFDVAELIQTQTAEDIASLDALISTLLNGGQDDTTYTVLEITEEESIAQLIEAIMSSSISGFTDEAITGFMDSSITAKNYKKKLSDEDLELFEEYVQRGIEASRDTIVNIKTAADMDVGALFQDIIDGNISEKELKKAGVSEDVIDAIKDGTITADNINQYRDGTLTLAKPDDVKLKYETFYYTHLGIYVGGSSGTILCSDKDVYGDEGCLANAGNLFLAWNMRDDNGRLVGTGAYIARLHVKVMVGRHTVTNITRDLMWGVRRGSKK
jgi:fibro-slime domain-containing protein